MSPTSRETVANRPLQAEELAKIVIADLADMLDGSGMFRGQIAYGRIAYEIRVTLHIDNPSYPTDITALRSKRRSVQEIEKDDSLTAIEPGPLADPSPSAFLAATERRRDIQSPNAARVEHGLPITVLRREQDGATKEEQVTYPKDALDGQVNPNPPPVDEDVTERVRREWEEQGR